MNGDGVLSCEAPSTMDETFLSTKSAKSAKPLLVLVELRVAFIPVRV